MRFRVGRFAKTLVGVEGKTHSFRSSTRCSGRLKTLPVQLQAESAGGGTRSPGGSCCCVSHPIEVEGRGISQSQHHQPLGAGGLQQIHHQLLSGFAAELFTTQRVGQARPAAVQFRGGLILKQPHRQHLTTPGRESVVGEGEKHGRLRSKGERSHLH